MDELATWLPAVMAVHMPHSWGDVLDAGTGRGSFAWLGIQPVRSLTGVTVEARTFSEVEQVTSEWQTPHRRLLVGDWRNASLLTGEQFDVVVCDYLFGSIDHFAPYWQAGAFARLRGMVRPGGLMVIVGREPLSLAGADEIIQEVERLRDAAMLLGGQRPYRELPLSWATSTINTSGFTLLERHTFERRVDDAWILNEIRWSRMETKKIADAALRSALSDQLDVIQQRVQRMSKSGEHMLGFDYALVARKSHPVPRINEPQAAEQSDRMLLDLPSCRTCDRLRRARAVDPTLSSTASSSWNSDHKSPAVVEQDRREL